MADNGRMKDGLSEDSAPLSAEDLKVQERRRFLRRAAMIGLPVVVATVRPRTAWATPTGSTGGCIQSTHASGCWDTNANGGRGGKRTNR